MEDCVPVGQTLFRKLNLYTLDEWLTTPHPETKDLVNLTYFKLFPAPIAGPFALVRDEAKFAQFVRDGRPLPIRIYTTTCSTKPISTFVWEGEKLLKLVWTHDENLLCAQSDGTIRILSMFGEKLREFKMDADRRLVDCAPIYSADFSSTGLVGLNAIGRFLYIQDISAETGQLKAFEDIPQLALDSVKWAVALTPNYTRLFVISDRDFYQVDLDGPLIKLTYPTLSFSRFLGLAVSANSIYIALLTDRSVIVTTTGDPLRITMEHPLDQPAESSCSLYWVGCDGVALFRPSSGQLTIFQLSSSDSHTEMMDLPAYFIPEVDGLRIVTGSSHDFLHAVPQEVSEVLALGSQSPAMYLYEANKLFRNSNPSGATEYLDSGVRLRLEEAVSRCISAALYEYKSTLQKSLLEAANLGRCFLLATSAGRLSWRTETAEMVRVIRILRVLNVVRDYSPGIPLTYKQFCVFYQRNYPLAGFQWLLLRLTKRRQAALAFLICDYLASAEDCCPADAQPLSPGKTLPVVAPAQPGSAPFSSPLHETVLRTWATFKLNQQRESEEAVAAALLSKLAKSNLLAEIARLAIEKGRRIVAQKLIEAEPTPSRQVPLLLQIGKYQLALDRAVSSHDPELISRVMDDLRQVMENQSFLVLLHSHESAIKFYLQQLEERHDFDSYLKVADQESDYLGLAVFYLQASIRPANEDPRDSFRRSADQFSRKKGYEWAREGVDFCRQLLDRQTKLDQELQSNTKRTPICDTLRVLGQGARITTALQMKKEYAVSDKSFWWAYANGLAEGNHWDLLEEFTRGKAKTPFGTIGVLEICAANNHCNSNDVNSYVERLEPADRVKGLVILGRFDKAFDAASKSGPKTIESDLEFLIKRLPSAQSELRSRTKELLKTIRQQQQQQGPAALLRLGGRR